MKSEILVQTRIYYVHDVCGFFNAAHNRLAQRTEKKE
jgi:hypothetical protein